MPRVVRLQPAEHVLDVETLALVGDGPDAAGGLVVDADIDDAAEEVRVALLLVEGGAEGPGLLLECAGQAEVPVHHGVGDGLGEGDDQALGGGVVDHAGGAGLVLEEQDHVLDPVGAAEDAQVLGRSERGVGGAGVRGGRGRRGRGALQRRGGGRVHASPIGRENRTI